jgi:hypothetical protein
MMSRRSSFASTSTATLLLGVLILACGGTTLDVGSLDAGTDSGGSCVVACAVPAGPVQKFTSNRAASDAFVGTWRICSSFGTLFPSDATGLEFGPVSGADDAGTAGGALYILVEAPSGPMRGAGFAYEYTYDVSGLPAESPQLSVHEASGGGNGGQFAFSACPRELELTLDVAPGLIALVAF